MAKRVGEQFEQIQVESRQALRDWLADNHTRTQSVWLIRYKKATPDKYLPYEAVVQELLCWGWIDSLPRKLDDLRTMLLISPRKKGSPWSRVNKRHIEAIVAAGQMTEFGSAKIDAAKADGSWHVYDEIEALVIPPDLAVALDSVPDARANFDNFPDSSKKGILWWIKSAKREATRANRIETTAVKASQNIRAR